MVEKTKPVAETNQFIVLESYTPLEQDAQKYQTEAALENELIKDLDHQGYEFCPQITNATALLANARVQLQKLNAVHFTDAEWARFVIEFLDKPGENIIDKTRKVHDNFIYDFTFDDGHIENIYLFDKRNVSRNHLQVIQQFENKGSYANRYDVTILVNGLPLVQIELKKRSIPIREAFNQIHRYTKESFNSENSLFKYLQLFVISNGTHSRYFANTTKRDKNSFDFTINWAQANNDPIKDLKDFTATFFEKNTLLKILLRYSIFDKNNTLLIMRPYQIAATERILQKIDATHNAKEWGKPANGGFIWHTTGSGKTLTSFKAAQLATQLDFIDKVFFVVDRKDLDAQTIEEYRRFDPESVNGSENTNALKRNLAKTDNKIIVTTIQKLNMLMKAYKDLPAYNQQVVFIFDECHRSQFGEAQKNLKQRFNRYYQFGFTGTPIFSENALTAATTVDVFGKELHSYVITDAIRDEKVLKFKVDYNDVRPKFKSVEQEQDEEKLKKAENKQALLHPERISEISQYILANYRRKTHRLQGEGKGFNAMLAVSSVNAAKQYYETLNALQKGSDKPLKIATIFSYAANEKQDAKGEVEDESFDVSALNSSAKEFLAYVVAEYNKRFGLSYGLDAKGFEDYYKSISTKVKAGEIDLLIVVGMFLTGFDAPKLNTLFVDKNLRYHGLIQAYSRTNRIYDSTKAFGNIVTFRDLEQPTIEALQLFGKNSTKSNIVIERCYQDYMYGYKDKEKGQQKRGLVDVVKELAQKFSDPTHIEQESDKKEFVKLFGEYLRLENILQNYDEFANLQDFQQVDAENRDEVQAFQDKHNLSEQEITALEKIDLPDIRQVQDYKSVYNDIRDWQMRERAAQKQDAETHDWDDVVFEVELLKSQEINLEFILFQIFEKNKQGKNKAALVDDIRRIVRASIGNRAKEGLLVDFIDKTNFDEIHDKSGMLDAFYKFANTEKEREQKELIETEHLNKAAAENYIANSVKQQYASQNGTDLNDTLPKMSRLSSKYLTKKKSVFEKISQFVEKFKGIGYEDN